MAVSQATLMIILVAILIIFNISMFCYSFSQPIQDKCPGTFYFKDIPDVYGKTHC